MIMVNKTVSRRDFMVKTGTLLMTAAIDPNGLAPITKKKEPVIDIHQQPVLAQGEQIIAAPTLIKKLPAPLRKVVGDLSNSDRVLMGLDLQPTTGADLESESKQ